MHRPGDPLVDATVALPGVLEPNVPDEIPQLVLQEPQRRIGELVVEAVEVAGVVGDQPEPVRRAVTTGLVEGAVGLCGDGVILLRHRVGDPGDLVARHERAERRDEAAAAPARRPAFGIPPVGDGSAVGDDDQPAAVRRHQRPLSGFRGRFASVTCTVCRAPSRTIVTGTVCPGRRRSVTARTTSEALLTGLPPIDDDHVAAVGERRAVEIALLGASAQARMRPRTAGPHRRDHRAGAHGIAVPPRDAGCEVLRGDADVRVGDLAGRDQLLHRPARGVDRHGEADPLRAAVVAPDLRVDPDHPPGGVEQRPTGVAVIDRRVHLDRVDQVVLRGQRLDRALGRRDDADRERVLVPERAADRRDGLADDDPARVAERQRSQLVRLRVDPENADVVEHVPAHDRGLDPVAILKLDEDVAGRRDGPATGAGRGDHVRVGQDQPVGRDDEAGALRSARPVAGTEDGIERDHAGRATRVDAGRIEDAGERRPDRRREPPGRGLSPGGRRSSARR